MSTFNGFEPPDAEFGPPEEIPHEVQLGMFLLTGCFMGTLFGALIVGVLVAIF